MLLVVTPYTGLDPAPFADSLRGLLARWPAELDAELLVPTRALTRRDRAVLTETVEGLQLLEVPDDPTFGELTAAAVLNAAPNIQVLVADPLLLDVDALLGDRIGGGVRLNDALLVQRPVLTAARDLDSLRALITPLVPVKAAVAAPLTPSPSTPGLLSVLLVAEPGEGLDVACLTSLRMGTRSQHEVVVVADDTACDQAALRLRRAVLVRAGRDEDAGTRLTRALQVATGDLIAVIAPDQRLDPGWDRTLLRLLDAHVAGVDAPTHRSPYSPPAGTREARLRGPVQLLRRRDVEQVGAFLPGRASLSLLGATTRIAAAGGVLLSRDRPVGHPVRGARPVDDASGVADHLAAAGGPLLSAVLIVKDEEAMLPSCLEALRGVADEVVVCDTGSRDRTVEIATAMGATVTHFPWINDFAAARNAAAEHARGEWVLVVDADERIRVDADALRRRLLAQPAVDGFWTDIYNYTTHDGSSTTDHRAIRLMRRETVHYEGDVHETPVRRDGQLPEAADCDELTIDHLGYLAEIVLARDKVARNTGLAKQQAAREASGALAWKPAYELARVTELEGDPEAYERALAAALALVPASQGPYVLDLLIRQAQHFFVTGQWTRADEAARHALALAPDANRAQHLAVVVALQTKRPAAALEILSCTATGTTRDMFTDPDQAAFVLPTLRGTCHALLNQDREAIDAWSPLLVTHPARFSEWEALFVCCRRCHGSDWPHSLAVLVQGCARPALAAYGQLPTADLEALREALESLGVDVTLHSPAAVRSRRVVEAVRGHAPEVVARVARSREFDEPELALALWDSLGIPEAREGRARCLTALGRVGEAEPVLTGVEVPSARRGGVRS